MENHQCETCNLKKTLCESCLLDLNMLRKAREWYAKGEIGTSSSSLCLAALLKSNFVLNSEPYDINDFKRCQKLIEFVPEIKECLPEIRAIDLKDDKRYWRLPGKWTSVIDNWDSPEVIWPKD